MSVQLYINRTVSTLTPCHCKGLTDEALVHHSHIQWSVSTVWPAAMLPYSQQWSVLNNQQHKPLAALSHAPCVWLVG